MERETWGAREWELGKKMGTFFVCEYFEGQTKKLSCNLEKVTKY